MKKILQLVPVCALCLALLTGCGKTESVEEQPTPTPTPTVTITPVPTPDVPVTPEVVVATPAPETTPQQLPVEIHGEQEVLDVTPVTGSFAASGGPGFSLLVDQNRYLVNDVGGYCYITLRTGMSGDVYAELGYRPGESAASLGGSILNEYGVMASTVNNGAIQLGANTVTYLRGKTVQNIFDVYLLDVPGGCVTMVMSTTEETEAHQARLLASLESLEIK